MPAENDRLAREIVERRLVPRMLSEQEEAAECIGVLLDRGFTLQAIAERCGVDRGAVMHWKHGRSAPKDPRRWAILASITRAALAMPRREEKYAGMSLVIFSIMQALDIPPRGVAERVGSWSKSGERWLRGAASPGRRYTIRLRILGREAGLPPELLTLCDKRLREIREREIRNSALLVALRRGSSRACALAGEGLDTSQSAAAQEMPMQIKSANPALIREQAG